MIQNRLFQVLCYSFFSIVILFAFTQSVQGQIQTFNVDGVEFTVNPWVEVSVGGAFFDNRTVRVKLYSLNTHPPTSINFNGRVYNINDFNGQLISYFYNLGVNSVSARAFISGISGCSFSSDAWVQGETIGNLCVVDKNSTPDIQRFEIYRLNARGVTQLRDKLRELIREQEREENLRKRINELKQEARQLEREEDYTSALRIYEQILALDETDHEIRRKIREMEQKIREANSESGTGTGGSTGTRPPSGNRPSTDSNQPRTPSAPVSALSLSATLEAEGDRLYNLGQYAGALRKYQEALQYYYSPRLAKKVNELNAFIGAALIYDGLSEVGASINRFISNNDPDGVLDWSHRAIRYERGFFNKNKDADDAYSILFGFQVNPLIFAFEIRTGFIQTAPIEHTIEMEERFRQSTWQSRTISPTIDVSHAGPAMGFSVGFGIPKYERRPFFNLNANFGYDFIYSLKQTTRGDNFEKINNDSYGLAGKYRLALGLLYQFPNTTNGIGIHYNYFWLSAGEPMLDLSYVGTNPLYLNTNDFTRRFNVGGRVDKYSRVEYQSITISFIYGIEKRRR